MFCVSTEKIEWKGPCCSTVRQILIVKVNGTLRVQAIQAGYRTLMGSDGVGGWGGFLHSVMEINIQPFYCVFLKNFFKP